MNGSNTKIRGDILWLAGFICVSALWEWWNGQIYPSAGKVSQDLRNYFSGFQAVDRKCLGWLLLHIPLQFFFALKQLDFFRRSSFLWYFRKKDLFRVYAGYYKLYGWMPFACYLVCTMYVILKKTVWDGMDADAGIFTATVYIVAKAGTAAVVFAALTTILFIMFLNFQAGFLTALLMETAAVMFSQWVGKEMPIPLTGTVMRSREPDWCGIACLGLELSAVCYLNFRICRLKYDRLIGLED